MSDLVRPIPISDASITFFCTTRIYNTSWLHIEAKHADYVSTMWKGVFKEKTSVQNDNVTFMLKGIYIQGKKNQNSTIVRNEIIMIT